MKYHSISSALEALRTLEQKLAAYQHAVGVLYLDATTAAPKDTARGRGRTMAVLSEVIYGLQATRKTPRFYRIWKSTSRIWTPLPAGRSRSSGNPTAKYPEFPQRNMWRTTC